MSYIHTPNEISRLHTSEVSVHAESEFPLVPRNRLVDLADGLAYSGWAQEATGEAGDVALQTELAVCVRAHEVEVLLLRAKG